MLKLPWSTVNRKVHLVIGEIVLLSDRNNFILSEPENDQSIGGDDGSRNEPFVFRVFRVSNENTLPRVALDTARKSANQLPPSLLYVRFVCRRFQRRESEWVGKSEWVSATRTLEEKLEPLLGFGTATNTYTLSLTLAHTHDHRREHVSHTRTRRHDDTRIRYWDVRTHAYAYTYTHTHTSRDTGLRVE